MKMPCIFGLIMLACSAPAQDAVATARFLAGLPVRGTPLESYGQDPAWAEHATEFDRAWTRLEQGQLVKIRAWAPAFLGSAYFDRCPMFYLFSGPDFLYAQAFFPNASTYILCGTEPVGTIPDIANLPRGALHSSLATLRKSLNSVMNWSFFITKDMKADLTQTQLNGTLPVFYVFLSRSGCRIDSVEAIALDKAGNLVAGKGTTPGVKIVFFGTSGHAQTLYYFTTDLGNWGIKAQPGFIKFCEQQGEGVSLLKAASYLMHENGFSDARDFLLRESKLIVQDDSGIPHRFFQTSQWQLRYCGRYSGPIELFKQYPQSELARAYEASHPAPLEFAFGYQWQPNRSSLLIAARR